MQAPRRCDEGRFALKLSDDERVSARSVVIASGARYRRLAVEDLEAFEASSVHYWASPLEAKLCAGQEVALVGRRQFRGPGGGLSGEPGRQGLAAGARTRPGVQHVALSRRPHRGTLQCGGGDEYHITGLEGHDGMLEAIRWRPGTGEEVRYPIRHLFLFIGAEPNTNWLSGSGVALDQKGFASYGRGREREPASLLGDRPSGVFAIGDVRSGSVKRVAAAVGEGAQVVATLHRVLAAARGTAGGAIRAGLLR